MQQYWKILNSLEMLPCKIFPLHLVTASSTVFLRNLTFKLNLTLNQSVKRRQFKLKKDSPDVDVSEGNERRWDVERIEKKFSDFDRSEGGYSGVDWSEESEYSELRCWDVRLFL